MKVYSVAELADGKITSVIHELGEEPVAVTRNGRFVAMIQPVDDMAVIREVLTRGPLADEIRRRAAEADANPDSWMSTNEVAQMLDRKPEETS